MSEQFGGGKKFDTGKLAYDLLPPDVIRDVVAVLTMGAEKYSPNNWQNVAAWRYIGALARHVEAFRMGEDIDPESGLPHLAHAHCNIIFLAWKQRNQPDYREQLSRAYGEVVK